MNLVKCQSGHFYDESRFDSCPHCASGSGMGDNVTVPVFNTGGDVVTEAITGAAVSQSEVTEAHNPSSLMDAVKSAIGGTPAAASADDEKTVSFYSRSMGVEPVVGWLVCIKGGHFGEDFRLKSGRNFIGRGNDMDVVISKDNAVSREKHAIVVYEPKGRQFIVMPGESKELCYLGGNVVLTPAPIELGARLTVGETDLMFIPCCGPEFTWDHEKKEG